MKLIRMLTLAGAGLLLAGIAGCGGSKYAKVSGVVTLDGKPYKNAIVSFQPLSTGRTTTPGRGSTGLTDENGQFSLKTDDGHEGAVVGKHRIRIQTRWDVPIDHFDPAVGSPDNPGPSARPKGQIDPIPVEWYADTSTKEFDVPHGGTDKANFDIVSKRK